MLVVGTNLEDLLVDSGCLGMKPVAHEIVRETHELLDRPIGLPRSKIQISEGIRGCPVLRLILDDTRVFGNRQLELPLSKQLLRVSQGGGAINGHVGMSAVANQSYQTVSEAETNADAPPSTRIGRRRRDAPEWRSLCGGRSRSVDLGCAAQPSADRA